MNLHSKQDRLHLSAPSLTRENVACPGSILNRAWEAFLSNTDTPILLEHVNLVVVTGQIDDEQKYCS